MWWHHTGKRLLISVDAVILSGLMKILMPCVFLFASAAHANLKDLSREFLQSNTRILQAELDKTQRELDYHLIWSQISFNLEGSYTFNKDGADTFSAIQNQGETGTYSLALSRPFEWGGNLTFGNSLIDIQSSPNAILNIPARTYQFVQSLSYSQDLGRDLFGKTFKLQVEVAEQNWEASKKFLDQRTQNLLLEFFQDYERARLNKTLIGLRKEALKRAGARRKNISKRVKDGLRERVDLYQADIALLSQSENVSEAEQNFASSLEALGVHLHRPVKVSEIETLDFNYKEQKEKLGGVLNENYDLQTLEKQVRSLRASLEVRKNAVFPEISLTGTYQTNDYDPQKDESIDRGSVWGGDQTETTIALNFSMPLSFKEQRLERSKAKIDLLKKEIELRNTRNSLLESKKSLEQRISLIEQNLKSSKQKRELSLRALKSRNRLYNLGRSDITEVISSEESLIQSEVSLINNLVSYKQILGLYAALHGKLEIFLGLK